MVASCSIDIQCLLQSSYSGMTSSIIMNIINSMTTAQNILRIRNPNSSHIGEQYRGIVEVFHNGIWGSVCNTGWTYNDAFLACRTAGFNSAVRGLSDANTYFGPGVGNVILDNVRCSGNEDNFFSCPNDGWGTVRSRCNGHLNDAGVICSDGELYGGGVCQKGVEL